MSGEKRGKENGAIVKVVPLMLLFVIFGVLFFSMYLTAAPVGPDGYTSVNNETKGTVSSRMWNISGGYISTFNLTATTQNDRWKAFVGNMTGSFTLDDASGSTIYDWTVSTVTGRVFATRNSSTINWGSVTCSNETYLNTENTAMGHNSSDDNITATFNTTAGATHDAFYVGTTLISANSCPTLNTYRNNASQDSYFEEIALYSNPSIIYATILENDIVGFDGNRYDFQMLIPENGSASWEGAVAYYIYVELG